MIKKRNNYSITAAILLTALLVSCGGEGTSDTAGTVTTAESSTTTAAVTEADPQSTVEAVDFGGENIHFLLYSNSNYQNSAMDVAAAETNGETLNDAVFLRNDKLIEKFNIDITWEDPGSATVATNQLKIPFAPETTATIFLLFPHLTVPFPALTDLCST